MEMCFRQKAAQGPCYRGEAGRRSKTELSALTALSRYEKTTEGLVLTIYLLLQGKEKAGSQGEEKNLGKEGSLGSFRIGATKHEAD